jgi:hypothetical protein
MDEELRFERMMGQTQRPRLGEEEDLIPDDIEVALLADRMRFWERDELGKMRSEQERSLGSNRVVVKRGVVRHLDQTADKSAQYVAIAALSGALSWIHPREVESQTVAPRTVVYARRYYEIWTT